MFPPLRAELLLPASERVIPKLVYIGMSGLGEGEEQLLEFGFGQGFLVVVVVAGEALAHACGYDLESGTVEGARDGGELSDDVFAASASFDHGNHARELPLRAAEPIEYLRDGFFVPSHTNPP